MKLNDLTRAVLLASAVVTLTACGPGTVIRDNGTTDEPKWHDWDAVHFDNEKGTFPNLKSLSQVRSGMTKDHLYELIGRPQYHNSWRTREWDYLFHFHTPGIGTEDVTTCQFKVLFDKDNHARSFYWRAVDPADASCPPRMQPRPVTRTFTLGADALFDFDRHGVKDMNPEGRASLDKLVEDLNQLSRLESIKVIGYTDRLGSVPYNLTLSQNRANTVKAYLVQRGVPANIITAVGRGKADQIVPCEGIKGGQALRDCLHPNRRVVLEIKGYITENEPVRQRGRNAVPTRRAGNYQQQPYQGNRGYPQNGYEQQPVQQQYQPRDYPARQPAGSSQAYPANNGYYNNGYQQPVQQYQPQDYPAKRPVVTNNGYTYEPRPYPQNTYTASQPYYRGNNTGYGQPVQQYQPASNPVRYSPPVNNTAYAPAYQQPVQQQANRPVAMAVDAPVYRSQPVQSAVAQPAPYYANPASLPVNADPYDTTPVRVPMDLDPD